MFRLKKWLSAQYYFLVTAGSDTKSTLCYYAQKIGFPFSELVDPYQWLIPFFYRSLPVLNLNALELDFPHPPHPEAHYVGPMVCVQRKETFADQLGDSSSKLDAILERYRQSKRETRSLIYCAFGRFQISYDQSLLHRVVNAIKAHPEWELVLSLGGHLSPEVLGELPPNVHVFKWVPQLKILEVTHCAIIHAGISSINECLYYKVPMVVYSILIRDQNGNAARVAYHGLGIAGNRLQDNSETIGQHIHCALTKKSFTIQLQKMNEHLQQYQRNNILVRTVDDLLNIH